MTDDCMTGEELGEKLLAAAREMAVGQGVVVHSPAIAARKAPGLSQHGVCQARHSDALLDVA